MVNTFVPSLGATLTHAVRFHLFMGFSSGTAGVCLLEIEHMRSTRQNQTETRVRIDRPLEPGARVTLAVTEAVRAAQIRWVGARPRGA